MIFFLSEFRSTFFLAVAFRSHKIQNNKNSNANKLKNADIEHGKELKIKKRDDNEMEEKG
jgi:hypothetical protein